ncbi:Sip1-related alpha-galactosidase [Flagellimonas sp.]|uniref:Sip1-related alpha-galactosidase n=1 Tax=Flagellimonas sp. TaxID=2058762 RepID=UPI003BAE9A13
MLFQLTNGNYLTLLPLSGDASVSWLEITEDGRLVLDYGTLGTQAVPSDSKVPLLAWYESESMYESLFKTWELALTHQNQFASASLRNTKEYPEPLEYLGWCTWEQYKKTINEEILVNAIDNIEESGVPVRWYLIDDGHQNDKGNKLLSYEPNPEKFPNGWNPITSRKSEEGIKWMGIWHGFLSHWNGVHVDHSMPELSPYLMPNPKREDGLLPKDDMESSRAFYDYMISAIDGQGFDFMKTDNVSRSTIEYYGSANPAKSQMQNVLALEEACLEQGFGLMNCSAQNTIDMLNAKSSATMRTSPDYIKHDLATSKSQILQSVFNVLWLGQTLWPDHDMFHSSDTEVGETMAVTKALSGGPIYLSDDPKEFNPSVIEPLCYEDGKLIRPEAPGVPMPSSIFNDALYENGEVYKTIAPLKNGACAIAAYNLSTTAKNPLKGKVTKADYEQGGAMIQPYSGRWKRLEEGLIIFDWQEQKGQVLDSKGLDFEIAGFGHKLYLLIPIKEGWSLIGRGEKYLSPSTVDILSITEDELTFEMEEPGNIILYSTKGNLESDHFDFTSIGNGFFWGSIKRVNTPVYFKIERND